MGFLFVMLFSTSLNPYRSLVYHVVFYKAYPLRVLVYYIDFIKLPHRGKSFVALKQKILCSVGAKLNLG
jgi:hypothetical protein